MTFGSTQGRPSTDPAEARRSRNQPGVGRPGSPADDAETGHGLTRHTVALGIDPGLDGAVALIGAGGVEAFVTPTLAAGRGGRRRYDAAAMARLLEGCRIGLAVIEAVGPMPKQGAVSTFGFGHGFGLRMGILAALRAPRRAVTPQARKKTIPAGTARDEASAIAFAGRRSPDVPLPATPRARSPHDGLADALCPGECARSLLAVGPMTTTT